MTGGFTEPDSDCFQGAVMLLVVSQLRSVTLPIALYYCVRLIKLLSYFQVLQLPHNLKGRGLKLGNNLVF